MGYYYLLGSPKIVGLLLFEINWIISLQHLSYKEIPNKFLHYLLLDKLRIISKLQFTPVAFPQRQRPPEGGRVYRLRKELENDWIVVTGEEYGSSKEESTHNT